VGPAQTMTATAFPDPASFRLSDRYANTRGVVELTGLQALVRLLIGRRWLDDDRGLITASFVSGYPGSPLAGLDLELGRNSELLTAARITYQPAVNEELAATAVAGSQMIDLVPRPRYQGVLGVWYGKAPGVDRAGDALKHSNYIGAHPRGGVLAVAGDDPECKSSSLPSGSEVAFYDALMPVIVPGNPQELLDLGQHSRLAELRTRLRTLTDEEKNALTSRLHHQ
jgi:indolepyruvate ferredoxin oxidoreductase